MNSDMSSPGVPPGPETPPASLTMVRVKRRRSSIKPSGKRGDLTDQLDPGKPEAGEAELPTEPEAPQSAAEPEALPLFAEREPETMPLFAEREKKPAAAEPAPAAPSKPLLAEPEKEPLFAEREKKPHLGEPPAGEPADVPSLAEAMAATPAEPEKSPAAELEATPAPTASDAGPEETRTASESHGLQLFAGFRALRKLIKPGTRSAPAEAAETASPAAAAPPSVEAAASPGEPEAEPLLPLPELSLEPPAPDLVELAETEVEAEAEAEAPAPLLPFPEEPKRRGPGEHPGNGSAAEAAPGESAEIVPLMEAQAAASAESEAAAEEEPESTNPSDALIDYWDSLRGGRDFPTIDQLDRALIAESWPNSVLLSFPASQPDMPKISRLGEPNGEVEYNAMVTEWILSRGRHSAKRGRPMEEEHRFPIASGSARYRLLLLPFGSDETKSDHVLCHVSRAEELSTVASFKRWLAG